MLMKNRGFNVPGGFILDGDAFNEIVACNGIKKKMEKNNLPEIGGINIKETSDRLLALFV